VQRLIRDIDEQAWWDRDMSVFITEAYRFIEHILPMGKMELRFL